MGLAHGDPAGNGRAAADHTRDRDRAEVDRGADPAGDGAGTPRRGRRREGFDAAAAPLADVAGLREGALLARGDVLRQVAAYDQAEADLRAEVAKQWPELHVGPGYTWERGLVKIPFSLGLSLPPLDLNRKAIAAAEARRTEAGIRLEAVIAKSQAAVDAALIERDAARAALARVRSVDIQTATRVATQADRELANGAIDRVDWSAARAGLHLAELAEIDALRRVHAADAALEDALRRPLDGPELLIAPQAMEDRR
jgi:outer membrane protein TolC